MKESWSELLLEGSGMEIHRMVLIHIDHKDFEDFQGWRRQDHLYPAPYNG
jgi:hypothetical protein